MIAPPIRSAAEPLYAHVCATCHEPDGSGVRNSHCKLRSGIRDPPLWGPDTFNDGAGMARIITFANFIHFNMPHGADYLDPRLSVENAWDTAAFVLSHPRPSRPGLEHDFPDLFLKPVDAPFGPYADNFSERQHKYGPFVPIRIEIKHLEHANGVH